MTDIFENNYFCDFTFEMKPDELIQAKYLGQSKIKRLFQIFLREFTIEQNVWIIIRYQGEDPIYLSTRDDSQEIKRLGLGRFIGR